MWSRCLLRMKDLEANIAHHTRFCMFVHFQNKSLFFFPPPLHFISLIFPSLRQDPRSSTHLSRLSLWANILQSFPLVCGASRLPHNFCRMETGMRKALGPTRVVMLLAGSSRDVSILWESCRESERERERGWRGDCRGLHEYNLTPNRAVAQMDLQHEKMSGSGLYQMIYFTATLTHAEWFSNMLHLED